MLLIYFIFEDKVPCICQQEIANKKCDLYKSSSSLRKKMVPHHELDPERTSQQKDEGGVVCVPSNGRVGQGRPEGVRFVSFVQGRGHKPSRCSRLSARDTGLLPPVFFLPVLCWSPQWPCPQEGHDPVLAVPPGTLPLKTNAPWRGNQSPAGS